MHFSLSIYSLLSIFVLLAYSCENENSQELSLLPFIADHMVLQQEQDAPIWGLYTPNEEVQISTSWGAKIVTSSDENGKWKLMLPTPSAGGPYEIIITTKDSTHLISDVMIGEVWLASGQSNMEMPLTGYLPNEPIDNYKEEIANAKYPNIRMFTAKRNMSSIPLDTLSGEWKVCSPETAAAFSATGYFFARKLYQELNVPIGILHTSWGGTEAEAWTSKEGLSPYPHFTKAIEDYNENQNVDEWVANFNTAAKPKNLEDFESLPLGADKLAAPSFDDSNWPICELPLAQTHSDQFIPNVLSPQELEGIFWYRKKFNLSNISGDYQLQMGAIDDADITYINGHKVGSTWNWQEKRRYNIPSNVLREGDNTIAILHFDGAGISSLAGPMHLKNENGITVSLEGKWACLFYADIYNNNLLLYGLEHQDMLVDRPIITSYGPNELPASLYNAMLHPLIPYQIRGVIWYQGERNVTRAQEYQTLFPDMIKDWRNQWNYEFPFYFVQIAPFQYGNELSPGLRDAQRLALHTPLTGMAITLDIGLPKSIHPGNKQDVGIRLALLALDNDYNRDIISSGPLYKRHEVVGNKIIIEFDNIGSGLKFISNGPKGFEIAGADDMFRPAQVRINNDKIELSNSLISNPISARYAWKDYFSATFFNEEGLPASSFTTE